MLPYTTLDQNIEQGNRLVDLLPRSDIHLKVLKRGALATTIKVTKPNTDDFVLDLLMQHMLWYVIITCRSRRTQKNEPNYTHIP